MPHLFFTSKDMVTIEYLQTDHIATISFRHNFQRPPNTDKDAAEIDLNQVPPIIC